MTDHNPHRIALVAIAETTRAEQSQASGWDLRALERVHAALIAARNAGDEADDDGNVWDEPMREGVEARMTLDALRRSLCRALGRRMTRPQILGPEQPITPPADEVLLSDVADQHAESKRYRDLRSGLAGHLGVDVCDDDRLLAIVADRLARTEIALDPARED